MRAVGTYTVTAVLMNIDPTIVFVTINGERIKTTPEHPFFTQENNWVPAGKLWIDAHVRNVDGEYGIVQDLKIVRQQQPMYNLSVEGAHTFYVGKQRWLVHNVCLQDTIANIIKNFPAKSGNCVECANAIQKVLTNNGIESKVYELTTTAVNLQVRFQGELINLGTKLGTRPAFHAFVGTAGGIVYDALTGPNGMTYASYISTFFSVVPGAQVGPR
jgi:hypothetical protein